MYWQPATDRSMLGRPDLTLLSNVLLHYSAGKEERVGTMAAPHRPLAATSETTPPAVAESTASGVRPIEELLRERLRLDERLQQEFRREITLLFSDIQDSTAYFERHGDLDGRQMLQRHNDVLFPLISSHQGTVLKTVRDTIMASFAEPLRQCRQPSPCSAPCATITVGGRWHSRFVCVLASTRARHWSRRRTSLATW